jgi:hypothetical protein
MLPAFIWSVANAFFLGCRDARRQAMIAVVCYAGVLAIGGSRYFLYHSGTLDAWFGAEGSLASQLLMSAQFIAALAALRYLAGRQFNIAIYRARLNRRMPWGFWLIAVLALADNFLLPAIYDRITPHIAWIWIQAPRLF